MLSTGNDFINLFSTNNAKNGQYENTFSPPYMCSPMSLSSESVRNYNFNKGDMFDLSKTDMRGISRETSPMYITQDMQNVTMMAYDTLKPFKEFELNSSGTTVMSNHESIDEMLNYNFTESETLNQTPNNEATSIAPSDLMNDAHTQDLHSKSLSLATTVEQESPNGISFEDDLLSDDLLKISLDIEQSLFEEPHLDTNKKKLKRPKRKNCKTKNKSQEVQDENTIKVKKVYNTRGKSISDSRLSTESLRQSFQLSSASAANKLEEYIESLLVEHCNFQLGYRTWVRDTEKDEREKILNTLEFQLNKNVDYLKEITGIDKKLKKRSIETIVRKCTYAKQQSRLRKERRKIAQMKSKLAKEHL
ncbi:uncharacterized protein HGUI_02478 [Hanseniaspora guilliermondii]|uniref:Uncharacterized protein n=1 Tax=Hanseniaspora guilliermondii TaxID=56406 RepID=A0A1L0FL35_9ASCO|nr:uncharacterized protein HGUI_02478 [Hanseniaspora guilliermondii]